MVEDGFVPVMSVKAKKALNQNGIQDESDLPSVLNDRIKSLSQQLSKNSTPDTLESIISGCKQLYSLASHNFSAKAEIESKISNAKLSLNHSKNKSDSKLESKDNNEVREYIKYLEKQLETSLKISDCKNQIVKLKNKAESMLQSTVSQKSTTDDRPNSSHNNSYNLKPQVNNKVDKFCYSRIKIPRVIGIALSSKCWHYLKAIQDQARVYISVNNNINLNDDKSTDSNNSLITIRGIAQEQIESAENSIKEFMSNLVVKQITEVNFEEAKDIVLAVKEANLKIPGCMVIENDELFAVCKRDAVRSVMDKIAEYTSARIINDYEVAVFKDDNFWNVLISSKHFKRFNCKYSAGIINCTCNKNLFAILQDEINAITSNACFKTLPVDKHQVNKLLLNGAEMIKYFQKQNAHCVIGADKLHIAIYGEENAVSEMINTLEASKRSKAITQQNVEGKVVKLALKEQEAKTIIEKGGIDVKKLIEETGVDDIEIDESYTSISINGTKKTIQACKSLILGMAAQAVPQDIPETPQSVQTAVSIDIGPDSFPSLTDSTCSIPTVKGSWAKQINVDREGEKP